jgi:hypothetical protein
MLLFAAPAAAQAPEPQQIAAAFFEFHREVDVAGAERGAVMNTDYFVHEGRYFTWPTGNDSVAREYLPPERYFCESYDLDEAFFPVSPDVTDSWICTYQLISRGFNVFMTLGHRRGVDSIEEKLALFDATSPFSRQVTHRVDATSNGFRIPISYVHVMEDGTRNFWIRGGCTNIVGIVEAEFIPDGEVGVEHRRCFQVGESRVAAVDCAASLRRHPELETTNPRTTEFWEHVLARDYVACFEGQ